MNLFKCACVAFCAILLCGCLESKGEFEAINAGKISAIYENGVLKMVDSRSVAINTPPQTPPARGGAYFDLSSLARGKSTDTPSLAEENLKTPPPLRRGLGGGFGTQKNSSVKSNTDFSQNFILFFFTTTCGVCKAQIPILQEIAQELENENIKIYGILGNAPNKDLAQKYAKSNAISLPIFYENAARRFFSQIVGGVKGVPVIVIFKDGKVTEKFVGLIPKGKILSAL